MTSLWRSPSLLSVILSGEDNEYGGGLSGGSWSQVVTTHRSPPFLLSDYQNRGQGYLRMHTVISHKATQRAMPPVFELVHVFIQVCDLNVF